MAVTAKKFVFVDAVYYAAVFSVDLISSDPFCVDQMNQISNEQAQNFDYRFRPVMKSIAASTILFTTSTSSPVLGV